MLSLSRCIGTAVLTVALTTTATGYNEETPRGVQAPVESAEVVMVRSRGDDGTARERPIIAGSGTSFRDCRDQAICPQMLVVPSSDRRIELGVIEAQEQRQARDIRRVTLQTFAIGKFEVSVGEYLSCVNAGACREPDWRQTGHSRAAEAGRERAIQKPGKSVSDSAFPIVGVSWDDATAYAAWLSKQTGQTYRLPSDAEWEYAARAGTRTRYWWGNSEKPGDKVMASCRGCGSDWDGVKNGPVASFLANPWGLHNVHGNAAEWVADFYCADFSLGADDGSARGKDDCPVRETPGLHVLRGGSSFADASDIKASARLGEAHSFRALSVGFRVARTLLPSIAP